MTRRPDGCTCDLEPSFAYSPDGAEWEPADVVDAECERVATCPTLSLAKLVAAALNHMTGDRLHVCLVHRDMSLYEPGPLKT